MLPQLALDWKVWILGQWVAVVLVLVGVRVVRHEAGRVRLLLLLLLLLLQRLRGRRGRLLAVLLLLLVQTLQVVQVLTLVLVLLARLECRRARLGWQSLLLLLLLLLEDAGHEVGQEVLLLLRGGGRSGDGRAGRHHGQVGHLRLEARSRRLLQQSLARRQQRLRGSTDANSLLLAVLLVLVLV